MLQYYLIVLVAVIVKRKHCFKLLPQSKKNQFKKEVENLKILNSNHKIILRDYLQ